VTTPQPGEMVPSANPPPFPGPALLGQTWRDLLYVHWPVPPASVARLFPAGTQPDTLDGQTFVGVVGLTMSSTHLGGVLGVGSMYELNVRLYSVDDAGRQGVVFLSMEVSRPDAVLAARLSLQLPYLWSHLTPIRSARGVAGFQVRRRVRPRLTARVEVEIGEVLAHPSALDVFLTARWGLHTRVRRGTIWVPITHPPFPLHQARLLHADQELLAPAGMPMPDKAPVGVLWSPGLDARIGRPNRLNG
jgi:uncharacterized protein YqjF (DUF2071 family)